MNLRILQALAVLLACLGAHAQVNSGSNGSDGAFNPSTNTVIDLTDHPTGIYQYTSVNIPTDVTVTFLPNANNTPVVWLVQSNVVINGGVALNGAVSGSGVGGVGGPGGFRGGNSGTNSTPGQGPGGGGVGTLQGGYASYGTLGITNNEGVAPGPTYGNNFLIPLLGGSGAGGATSSSYGGGGGGGAMLIASSSTIQVNGYITANGGGRGSGGAVRLVASTVTGTGAISVWGYNSPLGAGNGRIRFDCYVNGFAGNTTGAFSQGTQFVITPTAGGTTQLSILSVGGIPVPASPTGLLTTPDAVISAQQSNPIPIVVQCSNIPLATQITVTVTPVIGPLVTATGLNNTGTQTSSTATVLVNMPRGGGYISAFAAIGN